VPRHKAPIVLAALGGLLAVNGFSQSAGTIVPVAGGTQSYDRDNKPAVNAALNVSTANLGGGAVPFTLIGSVTTASPAQTVGINGNTV